MEDKPKMYQNKIDKVFNNNKLVYSSYENINNNEWNNNSVREKINNIINSDSFIYSKRVNIIVGNDTIQRKIIGVYNNNLITIDNEFIPIDNIKDIYI